MCSGGHSVSSWQLMCGKGGAAHLCRSPRGIPVERLVASGCLKARESRLVYQTFVKGVSRVLLAIEKADSSGYVAGWLHFCQCRRDTSAVLM